MANEWNKTAFVEFETMLRRHLRSGAAPVAACAGFDLDAASAYLEGALEEWRRPSYESHLAGCAMCRRHLIELARLAQAAPSFESRPAAAPDRIPAWNRWKAAVAGWFNLSTWHLKWQIAGATGAAFVILISALGVQSWRRAPYHTDSASLASAASQPAAEQSAQPLLSSSPEPPPQDAETPGYQNLSAPRSEAPAIPAPAASVRSTENPTTAPVDLASKVMTLDSNLSSEAPPATRTRSADAERNDSSKAGESSLEDFRPNPKQFVATTKDTDPGAQDFPRYQAKLVENKPEPTSKAPAKKNIPQQVVESAREMLRGAVSPLRKGFTESERKEIPDMQEAPEEESSKGGVVWPFRGKVFRRVKGTWIDQEYKPEMQEWRLIALPRDSDEYKRVLRDEPLLKEFFDKGPILIVWKNNTIYKVLK